MTIKLISINKPIEGYWFSKYENRLPNGDPNKVGPGITLKFNGKPKVCFSGYHSSRRIEDAASFKKGFYLYKVQSYGKIDIGSNKISAEYRHHVVCINVKNILNKIIKEYEIKFYPGVSLEQRLSSILNCLSYNVNSRLSSQKKEKLLKEAASELKKLIEEKFDKEVKQPLSKYNKKEAIAKTAKETGLSQRKVTEIVNKFKSIYKG